ncbi:MAG TPA: hypothetical protein VIZ00_02020 [Streptosporangiaceae bacterium]
MIFISVLGGLIVLAILLGVAGDYRARRHGRRMGNWNREAIGNRIDIEVSRSLGPPTERRIRDVTENHEPRE